MLCSRSLFLAETTLHKPKRLAGIHFISVLHSSELPISVNFLIKKSTILFLVLQWHPKHSEILLFNRAYNIGLIQFLSSFRKKYLQNVFYVFCFWLQFLSIWLLCVRDYEEADKVMEGEKNRHKNQKIKGESVGSFSCKEQLSPVGKKFLKKHWKSIERDSALMTSL